MFSLVGKTAIVTGAGSGKAIAGLFARQGTIVYVMDVDAISGNQVVEEIIAAGGAAYFTACNIGSEKNLLVGIDAVVKNTGKIDILVNNAGIAHVGNVESTSAEDFDRLVNINIRGVFHLVKAAVPYLKLSRGVILNMASVAALVGLPDRFAYSMTIPIRSFRVSIIRYFV